MGKIIDFWIVYGGICCLLFTVIVAVITISIILFVGSVDCPVFFDLPAGHVSKVHAENPELFAYLATQKERVFYNESTTILQVSTMDVFQNYTMPRECVSLVPEFGEFWNVTRNGTMPVITYKKFWYFRR